MAEYQVRHMKWWGWGDEDVTFSDADKPKLWPYLGGELGLEEGVPVSPVSFEEINLPAAKTNEPFTVALEGALKADQISEDKKTDSYTPRVKPLGIYYVYVVARWITRLI